MKLINFINVTYEDAEALYDYDNDELIIVGDYYHDNIGDYINGYIDGLRSISKEPILCITVMVTPNSEYFKKCDFVIDEDDYDTYDWSNLDDGNFDYEEVFEDEKNKGRY